MSSNAKAKQQTEVITDADPFGFLGDADNLPDDSGLWGGSYPVVQWNNNEKGRWEFPMKHWAGTPIEAEYPPVEVDHGESVELSSIIETIHLSVLAWRVTWEKQGEDGKMTYAAQPVEGEKWSKRYNFLVLIREAASDEPAILTLRGFTGQYFQSGYEQARRRTLKMARKATGKAYPGYIFWTPMAAGAKVSVGSKTKHVIYPPTPVITEELGDIDTQGIAVMLKALYIGDYLRDVIGGYLFNEAEKWATEVKSLSLRFKSLSSPNNAPQLSAPAITVLPGGILLFDEALADKGPGEWIEAAMALPGLFNERGHASNAFAKMLREKRLGNDSRANQWEAWRAEIEKRYNDLLDRQSSIETEKMLQVGG
jgi:hypothetical protein